MTVVTHSSLFVGNKEHNRKNKTKTNIINAKHIHWTLCNRGEGGGDMHVNRTIDVFMF